MRRGTEKRETKRERQQRILIIEGINNATFVQKEPCHWYFNFRKLSTKANHTNSLGRTRPHIISDTLN